jgi:arabinose-5-phosphate isomerase
MATSAASSRDPLPAVDQVQYGQQIIRQEADALLQLARRLEQSFSRCVNLILSCRGSVIVSGMGKAGLIGQKIAATLASTGSRSHFLHPAEAVHGDLGRVHAEDLVMILSHSGETEEVVRLLAPLRELRVPIVAITGKPKSQLGRSASEVLDLGHLEEAGAIGLAPSTSTTAMLALGDALALVASRQRGFTAEGFARFHPGGSLGRHLSRVQDVMRPLQRCRVAQESETVREVLVRVGRPGRRSGAVMLTGPHGQLTGIFTDSDLARLFEARRDAEMDRPICRVMTSHPTTISCGKIMSQAIEVFVQKKISELPVVDDQYRPCGLIDVTDIVEMLPRPESLSSSPSQPAESGLSAVQHDMVLPFPNQPGTMPRSRA